MEQPNYYSIMPASVRYNDKLSAEEKILYCEITSLCNKSGECWASNKYFANLYGVSERTIKRWIARLIAMNLVESRIIATEGNKRILSLPRDICVTTPRDIRVTTYNNTSPEQSTDLSNSPEGEGHDDISVAIDNFVDGWNTRLCGNCPRIAKIEVFNDSRKSKLKARLRETKRYMKSHDANCDLLTYFLRDVIYDRYINSQFLRGEVPGRNGTDSFRMDINHILRPEFFAKMLEHRYDDRPQYRNTRA